MPACKANNININYQIYGSGFPLVLTHSFTGSWQTWSSQIEDFSRYYQLLLYDVRGHGLSSAPSGAENYSLDILVEDLHSLLVNLNVSKAYIGGISMGGAISLGYAYRHPEKAAALLISDIDGGFQPANPAAEKEWERLWENCEKVALTQGMADLARYRIATGTVLRPVLKDKGSQEQYIERMARLSINGYLGIGAALPWKAKWQIKAADSIKIPTLIIVGADDELKVGAKNLHEHIKGSRYIEISNCGHNTAEWRPDLVNPAVLNFLADVESGRFTSQE